jgi:hypothetical protein
VPPIIHTSCYSNGPQDCVDQSSVRPFYLLLLCVRKWATHAVPTTTAAAVVEAAVQATRILDVHAAMPLFCRRNGSDFGVARLFSLV